MSGYTHTNYTAYDNMGKRIKVEMTGKRGIKDRVVHINLEESGSALVLYKAVIMEWEVMLQDKVKDTHKEEDKKI